MVYGYSGSGKTTLVENKLHQLYEDHVTSRCVTGLTLEQLVLDAFGQLGSFYDTETVDRQKRTIASSLKTEYVGIKSQYERESQTTRQLLLPPQLTPQTLARFLGEAYCCWVLEDFHKMLSAEKAKLAQVMKVFMDMSDHYGDLKIIAIGAVDTAREVVEYDAEMRNRVSEIYVPLMKDSEIRQIPEKGAALLNLGFTADVKDEIVSSSNGLASVCHQLCLNMCFAANINVTLKSRAVLNNSVFQKAVEQYLAESSDTLKGAFDKAFKQDRKLKFDDTRLIVEALLQVNQDGANKALILEKIRQVEPEYPAPRLTVSLQRMQREDRGMILRYELYSGRYSFKDPFYRAFALAQARKYQKQRKDKRRTENNSFSQNSIPWSLVSSSLTNAPSRQHLERISQLRK